MSILLWTLTVKALSNAEKSILIQKRHPYPGNLNTETSGDSKSAILHCGDVFGVSGLETMPLLARLCCRKKPKNSKTQKNSMLTWACRYVEALRPKSFTEHDLMDPQARFYFREKAIASKSGDVSNSERG